MQPRIEEIAEKILVGHALQMSLANNRTFELWSGFMPKRKQIKNQIGADLYSLQIYDESNLTLFEPTTEFTKWAAVEVSNFEKTNDDFDSLLLPSGLYAVFVHKGDMSTFHKTMESIFQEWLPNSKYKLDKRPHFELLGEKYKNDHPDSEEEVWVPVKLK